MFFKIVVHEITLKNLEFIINFIEKVKPFFTFLNMYVSWIE